MTIWDHPSVLICGNQLSSAAINLKIYKKSVIKIRITEPKDWSVSQAIMVQATKVQRKSTKITQKRKEKHKNSYWDIPKLVTCVQNAADFFLVCMFGWFQLIATATCWLSTGLQIMLSWIAVYNKAENDHGYACSL